jgi:hypothetical protein
MAKAERKTTAKVQPRSRTRGVLGVTRDGVRILKPGRGTHFTRKEARDAVAAVIAARS